MIQHRAIIAAAAAHAGQRRSLWKFLKKVLDLLDRIC
jgi:hypothetical protein